MSSVCRLCWAICIVILSGKSQGLDKGKELLLIYENIYIKALVSQSVSGEVNYYLGLQPKERTSGLQGRDEVSNGWQVPVRPQQCLQGTK